MAVAEAAIVSATGALRVEADRVAPAHSAQEALAVAARAAAAPGVHRALGVAVGGVAVVVVAVGVGDKCPSRRTRYDEIDITQP